MISVRAAREEDIGPILAIYNEVIEKTTAVFEYKPHTYQMRKAWFEAKQRENLPVWVAESDQQIIGLSTFGTFRAWAAYQYTVENSVYVASGWQGRGIGRLLMIPLLESARAMKRHAVIAGIEAGNTASLRLHQSLGFEEVAHFREVGYKFGRWLDLKFMELLFSDTPEMPKEHSS